MELLLLILLVAVIVIYFDLHQFKSRILQRIDRLEEQIAELEPEWVLPDTVEDTREGADTSAADAASGGTPETVETMAPSEVVPPASSEPEERPGVPEFDLTLREDEPAEPVVVPAAEDTASPWSATPPQAEARETWSEKWRRFASNVDWEQFTGVKLFAWLGGVALFIAAGFFVKFSIDRNLIPPALRLAIGALTGLGLIVGGGRIKGARYTVLCHTLIAGGIGVLYSVVFAATLYYAYISSLAGFGLLVLISAAAFALAHFYLSLSIAILGAVGAYATPILVSTDRGGLVLLLVYLAIVNTGLYQVVRHLKSQALLMVSSLGTLITLGLSTWTLFTVTAGVEIAGVWGAYLVLSSTFLWLTNENPRIHRSTLLAGLFPYLGAAAVSMLLLDKAGWPPLLIHTVSVSGMFALAWRQRGWYGFSVANAVLIFLAALTWTLVRFEPGAFSMGFVLLLLYGAAGSIGPVMLVYKYGINRYTRICFRAFPLAIVLMSIGVLIRNPHVSFWFWPMLLVLQMIAIGVSLMFRALIQVGLLVALFVGGALHWLFHLPPLAFGYGFFIFLPVAGVILCGVILLLISRGILEKEFPGSEPGASVSGPSPAWRAKVGQWLAASPAAGVFILLAASFMVPYPGHPHPGMFTLVCFLTLLLAVSRRMQFQIPAAVGLLAAIMAQGVWVFSANATTDPAGDAVMWSGLLFGVALAAPFAVFRPLNQWKTVWNSWALFEGFQALFLLYSAYGIWERHLIQWLPLLLAAVKLPLIAMLLRRLEGKPERNAILAFHGGVLLFYFSALPVLVLDHGWIGLALVFEASALLWLNRRIEHPGLRWTALVMAPVGLLVLLVQIPMLKAPGALPVINGAVLAVAAAVAALGAAAGFAGFPQRKLAAIDLCNTFKWMAVATGFFLVNLIISDLFAAPGRRFSVMPGDDFAQHAAYAVSWSGFGILLWRLLREVRTIRAFGGAMICTGAAWMILLPVMLPRSVAAMAPILNTGVLAFLVLLGLIYYLWAREPDGENNGIIRALFLGLFLTAGLMALSVGSSTLFQTGYPFNLFAAATPANALAVAGLWILYGLGLHVWPRRLDRAFRMAGMGLILLGLVRALALPFRFRTAFSEMAPLLNMPTLLFLGCLAVLTFLTLRPWGRQWPLARVSPRAFWGVVLAVSTFVVLNIEIAAVFAVEGRRFSMLTRGSLAMQLAYSIGWLLFSIGLMAVGIRWRAVQVRWAAIIILVGTAFKIFIRDLWSLGQLYRVGSLLGLAVVLIMVSFLYQRFLTAGKDEAE